MQPIVTREELGNVARFKGFWTACLRCHFAETLRRDTEEKDPCFSPEMHDALGLRALYFDQYAEPLLQMVTTQFQIACGRQGPWDFETFTSLLTAIPNQSGLSILLLETPPTTDPRFGPTGLNIYCGHGHGDTKNDSAWRGLPLRLKTYEKRSRADSAKLQDVRLEA